TESITPIDLVSAADLAKGGQVQLQQILKSVVPSFSMSQPATAGTLDFTSTPTLRGLGPGELLLMVNGKRRHSTGILNNNNQIGRGDVGYDFGSIPTNAIGRVEVLRDGASAQYGADAISGVINIVLDRSLGGSASAMVGGFTEGDGFVYDLQAGYGFDIGNDGVLRLSARWQDRNSTNRALPDTRQQYFGSNGTTLPSGNYGSGIGLTPSNGTLDPREATIDRNVYALGDPQYKAPSFFINADRPISDNITVYAFGGYSHLDGRNANFFRRAGQDETVRVLHPNGFRPDGLVEFDNGSAAAGIKGVDFGGFNWDFSSEYGVSAIDQSNTDSNNPSYGAASPTTAYSSGIRFKQWTTNFDLSREFDVDDGSPLKIAAGAEYRKEYYTVIAGDPVSYLNGGVTILDGPNIGRPAPVGFQPGPGLTPQDATKQNRNSKAVYAELEKEFFDRLTLSGAVRYEDFSDFGDSTTFKIAGRFEVSEPFAVRGAYSTGFRAPHLAQSFFSSTSTTFLNGNAVTLRLFPVANPVAQALGATALRPEKSRNITAGGVFNEGAFTMSVDAYQIKVRDRMALSSTFQDTRITNFLAAQGFPGIGAVSYMTNAIDTRTRGVDVTARYKWDLAEKGMLTTTFAGNYNKTKITRIAPTPTQLTTLGIVTPLFDLTQQVRLTSASPRDKYSLDLTWDYQDFSFSLKNTRYGKVKSVAFTSLTPARIAAVTPGYNVALAPTSPAGANSQVIQTFGAEIITDFSISYDWKDATFTLGANNLLDVYPDKNIASTIASVAAGTNGSDNAGTFPYNYISPFGYNGRFLYGRVAYKF
ncbi:MAG: TonB-dependent receptor, partial [Rhodospirillaceae bacterium]|nr:TonB-dependent receptor [Rhodospirillaceae bacterium]